MDTKRPSRMIRQIWAGSGHPLWIDDLERFFICQSIKFLGRHNRNSWKHFWRDGITDHWSINPSDSHSEGRCWDKFERTGGAKNVSLGNFLGRRWVGSSHAREMRWTDLWGQETSKPKKRRQSGSIRKTARGNVVRPGRRFLYNWRYGCLPKEFLSLIWSIRSLISRLT